MCKLGDSYNIRSGSYPNGTPKFHLFVIVTNFDIETKQAILLSFSRAADKPYRYDKTYVLEGGKHPALPDKSYAAYYTPIIKTKAEIKRMVAESKAIPQSPFLLTMVEEMAAGILVSDDTPMEVKDLYMDYLLRNK